MKKPFLYLAYALISAWFLIIVAQVTGWHNFHLSRDVFIYGLVTAVTMSVMIISIYLGGEKDN